MSFLYRHWTLAEALLALEHGERRAHAHLSLALNGQQLAACTPWSKKAGAAFTELCHAISERSQGRVKRPTPKTKTADVLSALSALGIPQGKN